MRKILIILFVCCLVALTACTSIVAGQQVIRGSGKVDSESRPVSGITGVDHGTIGDLIISLGNQEALTVEAEENLLPYLETLVIDGKLTIRDKQGTNLRPTRPVRYHLTVKSLQSLDNSSSGNINAPKITGQNIAINLSSSGNITLTEVQADTLNVASSSSGQIKINGGQAGQQVINLSSSGKYQAPDVKSKSAQVTLSSSGDANIWVTDQLTANLSSSGNINYFGSPQVTQQRSSSGKVFGKGNK